MTELPKPGDPRTFLVVDLSCWVHRFLATVGGLASGCVVDMITKVLNQLRPAYCACASDTPWPTFRHELAPKIYKAQRPAAAEKSKIPEWMVAEQRRLAAERLEEERKIPVLSAKGWEADDVIASLVAQAREEDLRVVVLAFDKDLAQLVSDDVVMWDGKERLIGVDEVRAKWKVEPAQMRDYLALVGDSADNVPGANGIGPYAASRILEKYGDLDAVLAWADAPVDPEEDMHGWKLVLRRDRAQVVLSRQLVSLDDRCPVLFDEGSMRCAP